VENRDVEEKKKDNLKKCVKERGREREKWNHIVTNRTEFF
jgi:hypothetical protein